MMNTSPNKRLKSGPADGAVLILKSRASGAGPLNLALGIGSAGQQGAAMKLVALLGLSAISLAFVMGSSLSAPLDGAQWFLQCSGGATLGVVSHPEHGLALVIYNKNSTDLDVDVKKLVVKVAEGNFTPQCFHQQLLGRWAAVVPISTYTVPGKARAGILLDYMDGCMGVAKSASFVGVKSITYKGAPMCAVSQKEHVSAINDDQPPKVCGCGVKPR